MVDFTQEFDEHRAADGAGADAMANGLRWMMADVRGRRVLWWLFEFSGLYRQSFGPDPCATAFAEGRRSVGLALLDEVHGAVPDGYARLLQEEHRAAHREVGG